MRKQAAVTLRCMQALVRVQARVRARRVRMSIEGQAVQMMLNERRTQADFLKQAEVSPKSTKHMIHLSFTCHGFTETTFSFDFPFSGGMV